MRTIVIAWAAAASLLLGCSSNDDAGAAAPAATSAATTTSSTGGGGGGGGAGGSGGAGGADACAPAAEPFGTDPTKGESFPDLQFVACDGTRMTMDELRCKWKLTLLSIGAGWCEPCKEETADLQLASVELADEGIGIVQVLFQDASSNPATTLFCEQWVETFGLTYPVFVDPVSNSLDYIEVDALPMNIAMDRDGKVLWLLTGIVPEDLEGTLRSLVP